LFDSVDSPRKGGFEYLFDSGSQSERGGRAGSTRSNQVHSHHAIVDAQQVEIAAVAVDPWEHPITQDFVHLLLERVISPGELCFGEDRSDQEKVFTYRGGYLLVDGGPGAVMGAFHHQRGAVNQHGDDVTSAQEAVDRRWRFGGLRKIQRLGGERAAQGVSAAVGVRGGEPSDFDTGGGLPAVAVVVEQPASEPLVVIGGDVDSRYQSA